MNSPQLFSNNEYTYADYLLWDDDKRYELFNGKVELMTPAPATNHQRVSGNIFRLIRNYLDGKLPCEIFHAPFDVRLPKSQREREDRNIFTVVQPDIVVICDPDKLDERGCIGVPDLVIEILSPSTSKKDVNDKFILYEESGVKEYWIVHPAEQTLSVFILRNSKLQFQKMYSVADQVKVGVFKDLIIDLSNVFIQ